MSFNFKLLFTKIELKPVFDLLCKCEHIEQRIEYHPEIYVLDHLLQCFNHACRETKDLDLVLAALLHDVGKIEDSHGHEDYSVSMLSPYLSIKSLWLIENHIKVRHFIDGKTRKLSKINLLVKHPWFSELVHLARIDKLGRKPNVKVIYDEDKIISKLNYVIKSRYDLS